MNTMKSVKIYLGSLAFAGLGMLNFGAAAQTPESLVKACSNIPSAATLKNDRMSNYTDDPSKDEKAVSEVNAFRKLLEENSAIAKNKAEEIKKEGDAAAKKEEDKVQGKLEKDLLGGKSADQMQKQIDNMSQAELMQFGMQMMSQMQMPNVDDMEKIASLQKEMEQSNKQFMAESERIAKEKAALKAKHEAMWKKGGKCYVKFMPLKKQNDAIGEIITTDEIARKAKSLWDQMNRIREEYYTEIIPEWLKFVEKQRADYTKTIPPLRERMIKSSLEYATTTAKMQGISLDALAKITAETEMKMLPWETAAAELAIIESSLYFVRAEIIE